LVTSSTTPLSTPSPDVAIASPFFLCVSPLFPSALLHASAPVLP